jgi:hypothetical protein
LPYHYFARWDDSFYAGGVFLALSAFCAYIIGSLRVETDNDEDENNNDEINSESKHHQPLK